MRLIFTDNKDFITQYVTCKKAFTEDLFVCWHWDIAKFLEQHQARYTLIETMLFSKDLLYINKMAREFARKWFIINGKDFSIYRGISLADLYEYNIIEYFVRAIKFVFATVHLIKKYDPLIIITDYPDQSLEGNILTEISSEFSLEMENTKPKKKQGHKISPSAQNAPVNIIQRTFRKVISRKLKYIILQGYAYYSQLQNFIFPNGLVPNVLFSCYRNEQLVLQRWLEKKERKFGICIDPFAVPTSLLVRLFLSGALILLKIESRFLWKAKELRNIRQLWAQEKEKEKYAAMFKIKGISIFNAIIPFLDEIVSIEFPKSAVQLDILKKYFVKYKIKLVVVFNSLSQRQRILIDMANDCGVNTLVIQHGLYADPDFPDKVRARFLALWGDYDREVSIEEGVPSDHIFVTGNPYFDELSNIVVDGMVNHGNNERNCKILVITNTENRKSAFGEKCGPEKYMKTIFNAINKLKFKTEVKVKLHPSENLDYYEKVIGNISNENSILFETGKLIALLWWSDIVILADSTVVYEANIMGCYIISLNLSKRPFVPPLDGSTDILCVNDSGSLAEGITSLWYESKHEKKKSKTPRYQIEKYMGKIDGKSTERVYKVIEKLSLS